MSGNFLLDTNIIIALFAGEQPVLNRLKMLLIRFLPVTRSLLFTMAKKKDQLSRKGKPIPENDIWIAAIALQFSLPLASRDEHFELVEGLVLETW